ncbi:unnamed protein product [Pieris brassicae]|uniref:Uncharacterized protein n=1 Tax=Pieris brassicae TaxID=7116 RepID=A0A9P0TH64_PIEBR|nr:unnamed protein product [Pieris brassicae]
MERYLSTHLDSSSRLDPNRSYWRAPLSPRASERQRQSRYGATRRETVILVAEWRPTGRGLTKELASDARSLEGPVPKDCTAVAERGIAARSCCFFVLQQFQPVKNTRLTLTLKQKEVYGLKMRAKFEFGRHLRG